MKVISEYQIEVNQIVIRNNSLLNKRIIDSFARAMFLVDIEDVGEYSYLVENNYVKCAVVIKKSGEWVKVKEDYTELRDALINWYKTNEKPENISSN